MSSTSAGGGGGGGGGGSPCGACKFLRRKCVSGCIFAPYFDSEQGANHFAAVHKVFGASNVSKLLLHIPSHKRLDAVVTICYEAQARLQQPIYGCVAQIFALQQQVVNLQAELSYLQNHLTRLELPSPPPDLEPSVSMQTPFSISDLPSVTNQPVNAFDLSSLFDPMVQPHWTPQQHQQRPIEIRQQFGPGSSGTCGGGDLQALARDLLDRHRTSGQTDHLPPISK